MIIKACELTWSFSYHKNTINPKDIKLAILHLKESQKLLLREANGLCQSRHLGNTEERKMEHCKM